MSYINNWDDNQFLTGSETSDNIDNNGTNITIASYGGNDQIRNWGTNVTIDSGDGNDNFYNDADANNVVINSGNGDDVIPNNSSYITINAGSDNDSINNWGKNVTIDGGDGKDTIRDWGGSEVSINGGAGNDFIYINQNTGNATINTGEGDDTVELWGSSLNADRIIQVGSGNNFLNLTNITSVDITGSDGDELVTISAPVYSNQRTLASATFTGGKGNDTLYGTIAKDVFNYSVGDGNDVIINYGGEDTINITNGKVNGYSFNGSDVVLKVDSQSITVKDAKNHAISIKDSTGQVSTQIYGNTTYTQHDVLKTFMSSLDKTTLTGTEAALDEAIKACSNFSGIQNAIDSFMSDCRNASDVDTFLKDYCGIILDNADTGAITGWDTGGLTVKDSDSVVPETGDAYYPTGSSITKRGVTLNLPSGTFTEQQRLAIQGLNSWWLEEAIKLVEESYGLSFYNDNVNFTSMDLKFYSSAGAFETAYVKTSTSYSYDDYGNKFDYEYSSSLNINMAKVTLDSSDTNGDSLDRIIAHEMTHALQAANIDVDLPSFIVEGMADLVPGIDDWRGDVMKKLAANPDNLARYFDLNTEISGTENVYAAGYMFLRYLAKQASDSYSSSDTLPSDTTPGSDDTLPSDTTPGSDDTLPSDTTPGGEDTLPSDTTPGSDDTLPSDTTPGSDDTLPSDTTPGSEDTLPSDTTPGSDDTLPSDTTPGSEDTLPSDTTPGSDDTLPSDTTPGSDDTLPSDTTPGGEDTLPSDTTPGSDDTLPSDTTPGDEDTLPSDTTPGGEDTLPSDTTPGSDDTLPSDTTPGGDDTLPSDTTPGGVDTLPVGQIYNGTSQADLLVGGAGDDTLISSKGKDTLTGGEGADVFIYTDGDGNDIITDYTSDEDTIKISSGSITGSSLSGSDVVLKIGSGSIKLQNAVSKEIKIIDSDNKTSTLIHGSIAKDTITGTSDDDSLYGNVGADKLLGNIGADTLVGGRGNDTLTGGAGKDVFVYSSGDGNDIITDYTAGQDKIKLLSGSISNSSLNGSDVVLKIGSGSIRVKNAKNKKITVIDSEGKSTSKVYGATTSTTLTVTNSTKSPVTVSSAIKTIDASKRTKAVKITGNSSANTIKGGSKADTIYGGSGNDSILGNAGNDKLYGDAGNDKLLGGAGADTLTGGKGSDTLTGNAGNDVFVYAKGDGNDVITDYTAGQDKIKITGAKISKASVSGSNVVLTVGTGKITVKNAKGKKLSIYNNSTNLTNTVVGSTSSKNFIEETWFTQDDNVISSEIDSILNKDSNIISNDYNYDMTSSLDKQLNQTLVTNSINQQNK